MALSTKVAVEFLARNRSAAGINSFNRSIAGTERHLRGLWRTALAVAGVGGLGYMIKTQMRAIDQMAKMSDELQISTATLAAWDHAAQISGTNIETLHKGLEIFVRRLGEAKAGLGEGRRGLEQLGISAQAVIDMGTEEAFLYVAESIKNAGTAAERAGLAYQFFGRQGVQLINMFLEGRTGIEQLRIEAEKLGITFSRLDASQVEAANDALTRMRNLFVGLFRQATIELAPYIEAIATSFVEWGTAGEGVGAKITNAFESITMGAVRLGAEFQGLHNRWLELKADAADLVGIWEKMSPLGQLNALIRERRGIPSPAEEAARLRAGKTDTNAQINAVAKFYADLRAKAEQRTADLQKRSAAGIGAAAGIEAAAAMETAETKRMAALRAQVAEEIALLGRLNEPRQHAKMLVQFQAAAAVEYGEQTREAMAATAEFRAQLKQLEQAESLARIAESIGKAFTTAFEDAIFEAKKFQDVMRALGQTILRSVFQETVSRPIGLWVSGLAGGLLSGLQPAAAASTNTAMTMGHTGGRVGSLHQRRWVDSSVLDNAARFHDLRPNEAAIIAEKGEMIFRPGPARQAEMIPPVVNIYNESGAALETKGQPTFDGEKWVVGIVTKNFTQGGGLRKMMRR